MPSKPLRDPLARALDDLPLTTPPAGFTQRTMQRVRQARAESAYFGLRFEDVVLPAFLAVFLLLMMVPGLLASYIYLNADSLWAQTQLLQMRYLVLRFSAGMNWSALTWISLSLLITFALTAVLSLWAWDSHPTRVPPARRI